MTTENKASPFILSPRQKGPASFSDMHRISEKDAGPFWRRQSGVDIVGMALDMNALILKLLIAMCLLAVFDSSAFAQTDNVIKMKEVQERQRFRDFIGTYTDSPSSHFQWKEISTLTIEDEMIQIWSIDSEGNPKADLMIPLNLINSTRKSKFQLKNGLWVKDKRKVEFEGKSLYYTIEWSTKYRKTIEFFGLTNLGKELVIHHTRNSYRRDNSFWGEWEEEKTDFLRNRESTKETLYLWRHSLNPLSITELYKMSDSARKDSPWRFEEPEINESSLKTQKGFNLKIKKPRGKSSDAKAKILNLEDYRKKNYEDELK